MLLSVITHCYWQKTTICNMRVSVVLLMVYLGTLSLVVPSNGDLTRECRGIRNPMTHRGYGLCGKQLVTVLNAICAEQDHRMQANAGASIFQQRRHKREYFSDSNPYSHVKL